MEASSWPNNNHRNATKQEQKQKQEWKKWNAKWCWGKRHKWNAKRAQIGSVIIHYKNVAIISGNKEMWPKKNQ